MINGLDSAFPPTNAQAWTAKQVGYHWWGFYLPKLPNTDPLNSWTVAQVDILKQASIAPVPICVPSPPAPADPIQTASEYVALAKQYGLSPRVAICYNGEHISVTGPVWLPVPQPTPPTAVGPGSALQWSTGTFAGLSVDFNVAAPDFPMSAGLVCDLEHNVSYTSQWYQAFQNEVAKLSSPPPVPTLPLKLPASAYPLKFVYPTTDNSTRWDIWCIGNDGHLYQVFYLNGNWSFLQIA